MARRLKSPENSRSERPEIDREGLATLSSREQQVLGLAAEGFLDKEISSELGVSINTLRTYWSRIRSKVGEVPRSALAVAYTGQPIQAPANAVGAEVDWIIDLTRSVYRRVSETPLPYDSPIAVDVPLDEALSVFHPQDGPRVRELVEGLDRNGVSEFTNCARVVTPLGVQTTTAVVRVERDEKGKAIRLYGRRIPSMELPTPDIQNVEVGYWERDLKTNLFTCDLAFCKIFHIDPSSSDIRSVALSKFHPDEAEIARSFVTNALTQGKAHARSTHRLITPDGSFRWATTDLRIEYDGSDPVRALGTVMIFH